MALSVYIYIHIYINRRPNVIPGPHLILGPDLVLGPHRNSSILDTTAATVAHCGSGGPARPRTAPGPTASVCSDCCCGHFGHLSVGLSNYTHKAFKMLRTTPTLDFTNGVSSQHTEPNRIRKEQVCQVVYDWHLFPKGCCVGFHTGCTA